MRRDHILIQARNIDWASMPRVVAVGSKTLPPISAGSGKNVLVDIPTQANTNYSVFTTFNANSSGYAYLTVAVYGKTATSFQLEAWNGTTSDAQGGPTIDWVVIRG